MRTEVLEAHAKMEQLATTIAEKRSQFVVLKVESEERLRDQLEAISVNIVQVETKLKTIKTLVTKTTDTLAKLDLGNEKGDKIIQSIVALEGMEHKMKQRLKAYGTTLQTRLGKQVPVSKDIDDIHQQLTKFKKFWTKAKATIKGETTT